MIGWNPNCPECGHKKEYNMMYDGHWCQSCDKWMENHCGDLNCSYCQWRPEKPFHHCQFSSSYNTIDINRDKCVITLNDDYLAEFKVQYCPECGLKLNKEADNDSSNITQD